MTTPRNGKAKTILSVVSVVVGVLLSSLVLVSLQLYGSVKDDIKILHEKKADAAVLNVEICGIKDDIREVKMLVKEQNKDIKTIMGMIK